MAELPLVIPTRPNAIRLLVDSALAALGRRTRVALEIDGVPAILDLVADGAGAAVLSPHAVAADPRPGRFAVRPIQGLHTQLVRLASAERPATLTQQAAAQLIDQVVGRPTV
jgi:LysR family nitrogen assimilation transcriptional regulator